LFWSAYLGIGAGIGSYRKNIGALHTWYCTLSQLAVLLQRAAGAAGDAAGAVCADGTQDPNPTSRLTAKQTRLELHFVTEDLFMVDLPPSVGSRVIVLPILSARFELLSPAVLVASFPVSLREHFDTPVPV
jgi:hypothetical protein